MKFTSPFPVQLRIRRQHVPCISSALVSLLGSGKCLFYKGVAVVIETTGWCWQKDGHNFME